MPKRPKAVDRAMNCRNPYCGKEFMGKGKKAYCTPICRDSYKNERIRLRNKEVMAKNAVKGIAGREVFEYTETVKCPKCEETYQIGSLTPPPKVMRRVYCSGCNNRSVKDYYDLDSDVELRIR